MSKKISQQLKANAQTHVIDEYDFHYLNDLDTLQNSMVYYFNQLKSNFLKGVALRLGYKADENLEFEIDLKSQKRELKVKKID